MLHKITAPCNRYDNSQMRALIEKGAGLAFLFGRARAELELWCSRYLTRRQMARDMRSFNDAMFEDFSMSRAAALKEVEKPFWRA